MQDTLQSIAEVSATLVGFSALFRVFSREKIADGHSEARLQVIIEQGLTVVLLCYLPAWADSFGWSEDATLRIIGGTAALWLVRWLYVFYSVWGAETRTPIAFRFALALNTLAFLSFAICAIVGDESARPLYLTGIVVLLAHLGWTFLFQVKAERSGSAG